MPAAPSIANRPFMISPYVSQSGLMKPPAPASCGDMNAPFAVRGGVHAVTNVAVQLPHQVTAAVSVARHAHATGAQTRRLARLSSAQEFRAEGQGCLRKSITHQADCQKQCWAHTLWVRQAERVEAKVAWRGAVQVAEALVGGEEQPLIAAVHLQLQVHFEITWT